MQAQDRLKVPPTVWGPSVWRAIHYIALGFPADGKATPRQKESYRAFFRNLDGVLPCQTCASNYRAHLRDDVAPVEDAIETGALFEWTVQLHNVVSRSLGKPASSWTPQQVLDELTASVPFQGGGGEEQKQWRQQRKITVFTAISVIVLLIAVILACIVRWVFDIRLRERA
jgi:hypothetical protein